MIVVNQDRTFIMQINDLCRNGRQICCSNYGSSEFEIRLAMYVDVNDTIRIFEDMLKHFTDKELYYLPKDKTSVGISAEEIKFMDEIENAFVIKKLKGED